MGSSDCISGVVAWQPDCLILSLVKWPLIYQPATLPCQRCKQMIPTLVLLVVTGVVMSISVASELTPIMYLKSFINIPFLSFLFSSLLVSIMALRPSLSNLKYNKPQNHLSLSERCKNFKTFVTIMCHNDELSWLFTKRFRAFYFICRDQPNHPQNFCYSHSLNFHLVAQNLLINNQFNLSSNSTHHCGR